VTLENADLSRADFSQPYLYHTRLDGAQINDGTQFCKGGEIGDTSTDNSCRYDSTNPPASASESIDQDAIDETTDEEKARARRARSTYSRLEDLARENGFPDLKSEMYIGRQDARRELLFAEDQRLRGWFATLQKWLFNYGESFLRIGLVSVLTIVIWWGIYLTPVVETDSVTEDPAVIYDALANSLLVFFSGNRVLETTGRIGEGLVVIESMIGPILVALLIFVLGRRAAR
jgi:hypothetical protein